MVMFGIISAVGLAQMSHTNQHSSRNVFILGFALYSGLSVTYYVSDFTSKHGHGPVNTSSVVFNSIANSVFSSAAAVALLLTLLLDNTIKGSDAERGLTVWHGILREGATEDSSWWEDDFCNQVSGLATWQVSPLCSTQDPIFFENILPVALASHSWWEGGDCNS
jgi:nucleobase transporter 1/2